jgi:hypothetical protein
MAQPTIEEAREIQIGVSARRPQMASHTTAFVTAPAPAPTLSTDGVSVLQGTGRSSVVALLAVEAESGVTAWEVQWWGYLPPSDTATLSGWLIMRGLLWSGADTEADLVPVGCFTRIYGQLVTITGSGGVKVHAGPQP